MCRLSSRAWRATYDTYAIELLQLHCPPTEAFYMPEVFDGLDALVKAGKLRHYGVSVEKVEKPSRRWTSQACLPLSSGMPTGKLSATLVAFWSVPKLFGRALRSNAGAQQENPNFDPQCAGFLPT